MAPLAFPPIVDAHFTQAVNNSSEPLWVQTPDTHSAEFRPPQKGCIAICISRPE